MSKKNLILGGVLIIMVAAAYIYQGPWKDWRASADRADNFLSGLGVDAITAIKISRFGDETILEKAGDRWKIGGTRGFYADNNRVGQALSGLQAAAKAEMRLVSKNETMKPQFQTDDMTGVKVALFEGDTELAVFTVGKLAIDFTSTYISAGGAETYSCAANLSYVLSQQDWYDRTIFAADKGKIDKIRFQYPAREFTITEVAEGDYEDTENNEDAEKTRKWEGIDPYKFRVEAEKVGPILDIMSNLTAADIPAQTFEGTGLEKNLIIIQATGEGTDNTLMIGDDNGEGLYYTKKGDSDNIYLITEDQKNELDITSMDLR